MRRLYAAGRVVAKACGHEIEQKTLCAAIVSPADIYGPHDCKPMVSAPPHTPSFSKHHFLSLPRNFENAVSKQ